ncbi:MULTISPECIES: tetratricopeptide repeat-containing sensor histidine kinase [Niastella]|uniref:histidine kinase n=1 Tax=Niastella soli TaxID=2821487 RepID=A0ABS3YWK8_9BACT|nr:tetratricopeptide repeat protein [Niastella soli]MBO9202123.1 tetratricopeptide repeat-containing sensor histidine kinase [Niastella soli]
MRVVFICIIILDVLLPAARAQTIKPDSLLSLAYEYRTKGNFDKSLAVFYQCLSIAQKNKDSLGTGNALIGIGIIYDKKGKYEEGLEYYFKALKVYGNIGNQVKVGGTLKNIGNTYRVLQRYTNASNFLQQALAVQQKEKDSTRIANILNDIGSLYYAQDSSAKALSYFKRIITEFNSHITEEIRANVFNNIGLTYVKMNRYEQALSYYQPALAIMQKRNDEYGIALVLGNTGNLYFNMNNFSKALEYHLQNLAIVQQINSNELLQQSYNNLKKTYVALGNYKKAYECQQGEIAIKDTVYKKQSILNYEEMQAKYQAEKSQQEIQLLQRDNQIATIELTNQRRTQYLLLTGIVLALILAVSLYSGYINKKRSNRELNQLNNKLAEANNSKVKLLSIITHDLRSPVSSLFNFLQLQKINYGRLDKEKKEEVDRKISQSAENLLDAMEDILIWSKSQMDHFTPLRELCEVEELLDEIIHLNEQFAANKNILLKKEVNGPISFYTDPNFIKIILRNLVSNAIKFTQPEGMVTLTAVQRNQVIDFSIKDTGQGIEPADLKNIFEWNSIRSDSSGLGLKLAREFTEKLGGTISVTSQKEQGTEFLVSFLRQLTE